MIPAHWEGPRRIAELEAKLAEVKLVIATLDDMIDGALFECDYSDKIHGDKRTAGIRAALAHRDVRA